MALALKSAARELGTSRETLGRWIRQGCPAIAGGRGRGKGWRVELEEVRAWRAERVGRGTDQDLQQLAGFALDFFRRGRELHELGHRLLGIPDAKAAALLAAFLDYARVRLEQGELDTPETKILIAVAREGLRIGHVMTDSVSSTQPERDQRC